MNVREMLQGSVFFKKILPGRPLAGRAGGGFDWPSKRTGRSKAARPKDLRTDRLRSPDPGAFKDTARALDRPRLWRCFGECIER